MNEIERLAEQLAALPAEARAERHALVRELAIEGHDLFVLQAARSAGTVTALPLPGAPDDRVADLAHAVACLGDAIRMMEQRREQLRAEIERLSA